MNVLQRKIGPFPGYVWAGAAVLGGLLFFYFRSRSAQTGQQGLPAVSPAASTAVPFVPNVSVTTGIPPSSAPPTTSSPQGPPSALWQFGPGYVALGVGKWVWRVSPAMQGQYPQFAGLVFPSSQSDPSQVLFNAPTYAWQWAPVPGGQSDVQYAQQLSGSGSGGYGYAGAQGLASPVGGWTVGWQPAPKPTAVSPGGGWGAGPSVNRTGPPRRARRLFGGSGDGPTGGSGGSAKATKVSRPLRRRTLSGR